MHIRFQMGQANCVQMNLQGISILILKLLKK